MLKNIPSAFTPDLFRLMMTMGHGEELLISDANFPAITTVNSEIDRIYLCIPDIASLLKDILIFFPLDETVEFPLIVMESARESGAYAQYRQVADIMGINAPIGTLQRFDFYKRVASVAGIVITASTIKGGNILLKKGVIQDDK
jgi:L-fucose mutarotase